MKARAPAIAPSGARTTDAFASHPLSGFRSESSEEGSEGPRMVTTALLPNLRVEVDDDQASYVLVFPRAKEEGGEVDLAVPVKDPKAAWQRIFLGHTDKVPEELRGKTASQELYQSKVRDQVLKVLGMSGFIVSPVESVDGDEVFVKIHLDTTGTMIKKLATQFRYKLPVKEEYYKEFGGKPMKNADGVEAPLYLAYHQDEAERFKDFTHIDEVRLIFKHLLTCMNLPEMCQQNIISGHFPGANFTSVSALNASWAGWGALTHIPDDTHDEMVRDYFGEEICFFFKFFALYVQFLGALGFVSVICLFRHFSGFSQTQRDTVLSYFGLVLVVWENVFHKKATACANRSFQAWGMTGFEVLEDDLPTYNAALENTAEVSTWRNITQVCVVLYLGLVVLVLYEIDSNVPAAYPNTQIILMGIMTRLMAFFWRRFCVGWLVRKENHRTQTRQNNALAKYLGIVKIFTALYPIFRTAFLNPFQPGECAGDLASATKLMYEHYENNRPFGIPKDLESMAWLEASVIMRGNETCISRCFPKYCSQDASFEGGYSCKTNCMEDLQRSPVFQYLVQVGCTVVNILIPVFLTRREALREVKKMQQQRGGEASYSFMALQAKCCAIAKYRFGDWGGSFVEDFLELLVTYALLGCFGMCNPLMAAGGFACLVLQYRLLAFRMTNVTCRPKPRGTNNFAQFEAILETVGTWAPSCNVAVCVLHMLPWRQYKWLQRIAIFILLEKALTAARFVVSFLVQSNPDDVRVIEDLNARVNASFVGSTVCPEDHKLPYDKVDIGLEHRKTDRALDESDSDEGGACGLLG